MNELIADLAARDVYGDSSTDVTSLAYDSRQVSPGGMFIALRGGYTDGHRFLSAARAAGSVAALVEDGTEPSSTAGFDAVVSVPDTRAALACVAARFFGFPSRKLTTIGVTGTDGKTTTSHFIDAVCRAAGHVTGLIGTVEVRIGATEDLHESRQTTPESLVIQDYLAQMVEHGVTTAVIEATSHGLEMHRLDGSDFDVGVVTNITHEHLDFHGTVENYRAAKGGLFRRVAAARASGKRGVVVVNADDEGARSIESYAGGCRMLRYSMNDAPGVDVSARDEVVRPDGSTFVLRTPEHEAPVTIQLPGRYNIANALAAATTGYALGLRIDTIATGLESLTSVPGRMERIDQGQPFTVIVDYAHSPEAIRSVLDEVRRIASGRVLVLFGSAGERDVEKRPLQGAVAIRSADFAMFTSEDPRFEDPDAIIEAIAAGATEAGGRRGVDFDCIEDRREAITAILKRAEPGDVVVLAGKGHERSMIYGDKKRPWSEADIAASALRELGYGDVTTQEWST